MSEIFNFEKSPIEELYDLLPGSEGCGLGFVVGTKYPSPHGLPAGRPDSVQETPEASSLSLPAKPLLTFDAYGFDFGTSPHGLPAGLPLPVQETPEASSLSLPAKPLLTSPEPSASSARPKGAYGHAVGFKRNMPNVYTSAKANCRSLQVAACAAQPPYYLRLGDREFLQVYFAVEHDRNRTRKAIGKGLCEVGDLRASDPLWQILQDVMTRRMKGYRL